MRRAFAVAAILAFVLPIMAQAQQPPEHERPGARPGGPPPGRPPGPQPHFAPGGPPPGPHPGPGAPGGPMGPHPGPMAGPRPGPMMGPHPGPGPGPIGPHTQFGYHGHFFNPVHVSPFMYPPGWAYRRWAPGAVLPPVFLTPEYYYPEWAALGLDPPPPGAQWVRYGPDMLLVDTSTGSVIETVPDVFYE